MPFIDYTIRDSDGELTVKNETADLYRYPDLTVQIESLCKWFEAAVRKELVDELRALRAIDLAKVGMRAVLELPDQRENLFLRLCMQNFAEGQGHTLSNSKRNSLFAELTDAEVAALESRIQKAFAEANATTTRTA